MRFFEQNCEEERPNIRFGLERFGNVQRPIKKKR